MNLETHKLPIILQEKLPTILALCQKHKVKELWVFGSILREDFSHTSDIDFLYEMDDERITDEESYDCFWGFYDALIALFDRKIDLVWYYGIKNPYFKEEVDGTKVLIYRYHEKATE